MADALAWELGAYFGKEFSRVTMVRDDVAEIACVEPWMVRVEPNDKGGGWRTVVLRGDDELTDYRGFSSPTRVVSLALGYVDGFLSAGDEQGERSVFDLFREVEAHEDYVFGTVFVKGDFGCSECGGFTEHIPLCELRDDALGVPDGFSAKAAKDRLAEEGNEYIAWERSTT